MLTERCLRLLGLIAPLATLAGCGTLYLAQAAQGQWRVLRARQPIIRVVQSPQTPPELRARLIELRDAREFASRELGLPDNGSYRSYADIQRRFVVWNVVATPALSVRPLHWCFPIAGCVAYRGYFSERRARDFALTLRSRGYDVTVGGVPAYSTLGHFADPVLSSMLPYGDTELAAMVFHELAHQLVYVAGDTEFDEAFAVTVEQVGLERWLRVRARQQDLELYRAQRAEQTEFVALFRQGRERLARLYRLQLESQAMRQRKQILLDGLSSDIRALGRKYGGQTLYGEWLKEGLNNAHLVSVASYYDCVPGFEWLLAQQHGDLAAFYAAVRRLAGRPRAERHAQLCTGR